VHRGKRTVLTSMTAAVVVVAAVSGAAQGAGANRLDTTLRTNQVQVLATHNSYHIEQDAPIQSSPTTQYTHAPLDQQLDQPADQPAAAPPPAAAPAPAPAVGAPPAAPAADPATDGRRSD
jgi:hypothetical protein